MNHTSNPSLPCVFVTGATGCVGRHVVAELIRQGFSVIALTRHIEKAQTIKQLQLATLIEFDLAKHNYDFDVPADSILMHCAWEDVRDTLSLKHVETHWVNHYRFIKHMIDAGTTQILVTGSCYEYGLQYGPVNAFTPTSPNTPYALAKDTLHQALRFLQAHTSFNLLWPRLFYLYGEGQDPKSIIPQFDAALERGDPTFNMSYGEQLFDYLPVETIATQLVRLLEFKNGVFNVCSGKPISLRRLLEQRMREKQKMIELNLGYYEYRAQDSLAIWGSDPVF